MKSYSVTIQMKPLLQYFPMPVLFATLCKMALTSLTLKAEDVQNRMISHMQLIYFPSEMQLFILKNVVTSYRHSNLGC